MAAVPVWSESVAPCSIAWPCCWLVPIYPMGHFEANASEKVNQPEVLNEKVSLLETALGRVERELLAGAGADTARRTVPAEQEEGRAEIMERKVREAATQTQEEMTKQRTTESGLENCCFTMPNTIMERKLQQLLAEVENRDQQLKALSDASSQVSAQKERIIELESVVSDREAQLASLQSLAVSAEASTDLGKPSPCTGKARDQPDRQRTAVGAHFAASSDACGNGCKVHGGPQRWDPMGLPPDGNEAASKFKCNLSIEVKHGRVSLAAYNDYFVPEHFKWLGETSFFGLKFAEIPNGLAAPVQPGFCASICEGTFGKGESKTGDPGEYGRRVLTASDSEGKEKKHWDETGNTGEYDCRDLASSDPKDRLAVDAIADPRWDPMVLPPDGDNAAFKRKWSIEIKHGRVSLAAFIGCWSPDYFKWLEEISTSIGWKFADTPNGLAAHSQFNALEWAQLVFCTGICEGTSARPEYVTGNPGQSGRKGLTSSGPEEKRNKLRTGILKGRLAMVAIGDPEEVRCPRHRAGQKPGGDEQAAQPAGLSGGQRRKREGAMGPRGIAAERG